MFTDQAIIFAKAGKGGAGKSSFLRAKYVPFGGPNGGDGGNGGSVYVVARTKLNSLTEFRLKTEFCAQNGEPGGTKCMFGKKGEDLYIEVPCGTIIKNRDTKKKVIDLVRPDEPFLLAKGGKGGLGNVHFATSRKQAPRYAQPGLPGEEMWLELELKIIADIGIIGLPNAGKSTLLKALTRANPKIANYPFTTLAPNLGVMKIHDREFVLADIPGLIEGAAQGKGLGHDFLRHTERTKYLIHVIDISGFSGDPLQNYDVIMNELKEYSAKLVKKKEIIVLNKADVPESVEYKAAILKKLKAHPHVEISAVTGQGLNELKDLIFSLYK